MEISIITANKARDNVKNYQSSMVLCLDSKDKDLNAIHVYKFAEGAIQRDSIFGRFDVDLLIVSEEPFEKVLNINKVTSFFEERGYCIKFYDKTTSNSAMQIVGDGKYIMLIRIGW